MTVVKVKIQKDFTIIYNGVLENERLSFKAKGLWAYCMSRPDNWNFHVNHLAKVSKDGIDAVYSALKELEAEGLVQKTQKNEKGCFGPVDYIIFPYPQEIQKILPLRDFPQTEDPQTVNPVLTSTDPLPSTEKTTTREENVVVSLDDPDGIQESLKKGGVSPEKYPQALELWKKYKEEIKKKNDDNPLGYLIWMVKKDTNPFKSKELKQQKSEWRKQWAYQHQWTTNCGAATATSLGMEITSGSISTFYPYDEDSKYWEGIENGWKV